MRQSQFLTGLLPTAFGLLLCVGCSDDAHISGPGGLGSNFGLSNPTLTLCSDAFCINGQKTFLVGMSYYGGLGASDAALQRDLNDMERYGFNWLRVWAQWDVNGNVSALSPSGAQQEPYFSQLQRLIQSCAQRGIIVDVSLAHGEFPFPVTVSDHLTCVTTLAQELRPYRNVYFDVCNEFDINSNLTVAEIGDLVTTVKRLDPDRLCTASTGDRLNPHELFTIGHVDFLTPHLNRLPDTSRYTFGAVVQLKSSGNQVNVHLQEPFRRGYDLRQAAGELPEWTAQDFLDDLSGAKLAGAAGWCLHNGDTYGGAPYKSFDLRQQRLFDQFDPVEMQVAKQIVRYQ